MGVACKTGTIPTEKGMIVCSGVAEEYNKIYIYRYIR